MWVTMSKSIVVALGGNALGNTPEEQKKLVAETAGFLVDLVEEGHHLILSHGNGPQVGMINSAFDHGDVPSMPFPECGAMSQGYIGYHLQNALQRELNKRNLTVPVVTLVTQVVVDKEDPGFKNPTKYIGNFCTEEQAKILEQEKGFVMKEDSGRGYRRVVASPKPLDVVELKSIQNLKGAGHLVITVGGGGIPVIKKDQGYEGVAAVIDKDHASALVAKLVDADELVILTAVENVSINFNTPEQVDLHRISAEEAREYIAQGQFAPGSMLPKVEACLHFVEGGENREALITSLSKCREGMRGKTGTRIFRD